MTRNLIRVIAAGLMVFGIYTFESNSPQAHGDPFAPVQGDPHIPNMGSGWCPGGQVNFGATRLCAGVPFSDGTFYLQKMVPNWYQQPMGGGMLPVCATGNLAFAVIAPDGCNG